MVAIPAIQVTGAPDDNLGAMEVAAQLTGDEVRALTAVEDEKSSTLSMMPARMAEPLGRRRGRT